MGDRFRPEWVIDFTGMRILAIPDAISQLEALDRPLLTRRDIEQLFGVSKVRAAALMQTFGAEMTGNQRTLPRTKLLRQLRKHRSRAAFRHEEERRERLVSELRKARLTGILRIAHSARGRSQHTQPRPRPRPHPAATFFPFFVRYPPCERPYLARRFCQKPNERSLAGP